MREAMRNFYSADDAFRDGLSRQDYRDYVAGLYMAAADANYAEFRNVLSSGQRNSAMGFDLASLLLTGGASVAGPSTAQNLSTAATIMTGTRASVDRNLFFDRTIPAIIAAMDAERARARVDLIQRLRLNATEYPLTMFFADLHVFELAASLDRAVATVVRTSSQDRDEANEALDQALRACLLDDGGDDAMTELADAFGDEDFNRANIEIAAGVLGVTFTAETSDDALLDTIGERLETNYCRAGARAEVIGTITERIAAVGE
jgi:hypothetical protein